MYVSFCSIQMNAYTFGFIEIRVTEQLIKWNTPHIGFGFGNIYIHVSTTDANLYFYFRFQSKIVCVLWRSLQVNCIIDRPWTPYCCFRVFFLCLSCSFSFLCIKETWWPLCSISGTAFYRTHYVKFSLINMCHFDRIFQRCLHSLSSFINIFLKKKINVKF